MSDERFRRATGSPPGTRSKPRPSQPADLDDEVAEYDPYQPQGRIFGTANGAAWCSLGALTCAAVGPFSCYMSYFLSLVLGAVTIWLSARVLRAPGSDPETRAARTLTYASMTGGIISFFMSAGFVLLFLLIMLLYVAMFVVAIIGAAAGA